MLLNVACFQEAEEEKQTAVEGGSTESREDGTTIATARAERVRMATGVTEAMVGGEEEQEEGSGATTPSMIRSSPTIRPRTSSAEAVPRAIRIPGRTTEESKMAVTIATAVKVDTEEVQVVKVDTEEEGVVVMVVRQVDAVVMAAEEEEGAMVVHQGPRVEVMAEDSFTNTTTGHRTVEEAVVEEEEAEVVGEVVAVVATEAPKSSVIK